MRILNVYTDNWPSKYIKQQLIRWKVEVGKITIIIRESNTPLSLIFGTKTGETSKVYIKPNVTTKQQNLIDIYVTPYQQ